MMTIDYSQVDCLIRRYHDTRGKPRQRIIARPVLLLNLYFDLEAAELAPHLARLLEAYLEFIPEDVLNSRRARDGFDKTTKRGINNDLKKLNNLPSDYRILVLWGQNIHHPFDDVGEYSVLADAGILEYHTERDGLVRLSFPLSLLEGGVEPILQFMVRALDSVPLICGNAGCGFLTVPLAAYNGDRRFINSQLMRYSGFDPGLESLRLTTTIPTAHWINFINKEMANTFGGIEGLKESLPLAEITLLDNSIMIRAAEFPPIGDTQSANSDLGLIPDVARVLKPLRFTRSGFDEEARWFDPKPWLSRFDLLSSSVANRPKIRKYSE